MKILPNYILPLLILIFATVILMGCENRNITPFEDSEGTYSMYGALELDKTPNYIRVKDLTIPFLSDSAKSLDAKVTFENLQEGISTVLKDTIVNFSGNYTHNFIVDQQLDPEKTYKVTVEGSDGESVTSTATTPSITQVELTEDNGAPVTDSVLCRQSLTFTYINVREPEYIRMHIGFKYEGSYHWSKVGKVDQLEHAADADEMFLTLSTQQLMVEVFPPSSIDNPGIDPRFLSPTVQCRELDSQIVKVRYFHFGPDWDRIKGEDGPTDPTESPDVKDGLGFLGAYRQDTFTFKFYVE